MFTVNFELCARLIRSLEHYARSTLLVLCELCARLSMEFKTSKLELNLPLSEASSTTPVQPESLELCARSTECLELYARSRPSSCVMETLSSTPNRFLQALSSAPNRLLGP